MSKRTGQASDPSDEYRCPRCDSIVPPDAQRCLMCGYARQQPAKTSAVADASPITSDETRTIDITNPPPIIPDETLPIVIARPPKKRGSSLIFWIVTALVIAGLTTLWFILRNQAPVVMAAFIPTTTQLPPTITATPTWTPLPSETAPPSETPGPTETVAPSSTPRDPRAHTVTAGETLFGLSLLYRISADSIAQSNGFDINTPIQSGQSLIIPWPTATPPLESVLLEINGEQVMADATNCEIITIQSGDSAYGLSALKGVPLEAIIAVNRQTQESIQLIQPGDTLCIPKLLYGDTIPPTAGPSPTPSLTPPPGGPALLYPVDGSIIEGNVPLILQWTAVKDLNPDEWYMVEMRDDEDRDSLPHRGFTRDQSFSVPPEWRPAVEDQRQTLWQVSIVQVTGRRSDGGFIYTFGGKNSLPAYFEWQGAVPAATPRPAATPAPEP